MVFVNFRMYVYGGYQILKGMMSDFYCIDLDDGLEMFNWEQIEGGGEVPGPRSKHGLIGGRKRIYLIGGLLSNTCSSSEIYEYDVLSNNWCVMKPDGDRLP